MFSLFKQGPKTNSHETYYWNLGIYTLTLGIVAHLVLIGLFYWLDIPIMVLVNIVGVCVYLFCTKIYPRSLANRDYRILGLLVYFSIISHSSLACYYLGMNSGFQYHIFTLMALPFFSFQLPTIVRIFGALLLITVSVFLELYIRPSLPQVIVNSDQLEIIKTINLLIFLLTSSGISYFYSYALKQHQQTLTALANIDPLTGLYNRRHLIRVAENEIHNQPRTNNPLSLILIDIDKFKTVNDTYGHDAGDVVLKNLADIISANIRPLNVASRWGGEEFVILLPNTNAKDAKIVAERLRNSVEKSVVVYENTEINVTITLGCTTSTDNNSLNELLLAADTALYKGKEQGRNQTVTA
ncbi:hypothetical protein A9Q78_00265 [Methylophaga sp. 41_12_T18]|nr:hypothetical protein A9Q78_00265 [Methylophaga sp. 41_12_T18]